MAGRWRRNVLHQKLLAALAMVLCTAPLNGATVLDTANENGCGKFVDLIHTAGLENVLHNAVNITLFAPSDEAVLAAVGGLPSNPFDVQDLLAYHAIIGVKMAADFENDELLPTISSENMRTNVYKGNILTVEGITLGHTDLLASNGVVHVIDQVIYPVVTSSVSAILTGDPRLQGIYELISEAVLINALQDTQGFTLFAPNASAIASLPEDDINDLLSDLSQLQALVLYHVVPGTFYSAGLYDGQLLTTSSGLSLQVKVGPDGVTVNGVPVLESDIKTTDGVIHLIDSVLNLPVQ